MSRDQQKIANDLSGPASCLKRRKTEREREDLSEQRKQESEKYRVKERETGKTV